jgi:hypothetical protein
MFDRARTATIPPLAPSRVLTPLARPETPGTSVTPQAALRRARSAASTSPTQRPCAQCDRQPQLRRDRRPAVLVAEAAPMRQPDGGAGHGPRAHGRRCQGALDHELVSNQRPRVVGW